MIVLLHIISKILENYFFSLIFNLPSKKLRTSIPTSWFCHDKVHAKKIFRKKLACNEPSTTVFLRVCEFLDSQWRERLPSISVKGKRLDFQFKRGKMGARCQVVCSVTWIFSCFLNQFISANMYWEATLSKLWFIFLAFLFFQASLLSTPMTTSWGNPIWLLFRKLDLLTKLHKCIHHNIFSTDIDVFTIGPPFTWDATEKKEKSRADRGQGRNEGRIKQDKWWEETEVPRIIIPQQPQEGRNRIYNSMSIPAP